MDGRFGWSAVALVLVAGAFLALADEAEASHMRGGTLYYEPNGTAQTVHVEGSIQWRWSYFNNPAMGSIVAAESMRWGDGTTQVFAYRVSHIDAAEDWMMAELVTPGSGWPLGVNHTYPADDDNGNPWYAYLTRCCRNDRVDPAGPTRHINNPSADQTLSMQIDLTGNNSSPRVFVPPIYACARNAVCTIPVPHYDPDGDPVTFRWSTDIEAVGVPPNTPSDRIPVFYQPGEGGLHAPNAATIDPNSGTITWDTTGATDDGPATVTVYSAQFMATDGTGTVPMDFFIELSDLEPPYWVMPPSPCGQTLGVPAGSTLSYTVEAAHNDTNRMVTMYLAPTTPLPAGATSPIGAAANPIASTFSWTPGVADVGDTYPISYMAHVASSYAPPCTVTVEVLPVNAPPVADFSCTAPSSPYLQIDFRDTSTDADNAIVAWAWDFGDAATDTVQHPSHGYASAGTYTVELTVTDTWGATDAATKECTAYQNAPPVAGPLEDQVVGEGSTLSFGVPGYDPDGDPTFWTWDGPGLPGARFENGVFTWTPFEGLAGTYGPITFTIWEDTADSRSDSVAIHILVLGPGEADAPDRYDADGDGVPDGHDDCPATAGQGVDGCPESDQASAGSVAGDGTPAGGEAIRMDRDGDGIVDGRDNCPDTVNPSQLDEDLDGIGDACQGIDEETSLPAPPVDEAPPGSTATDTSASSGALLGWTLAALGAVLVFAIVFWYRRNED